MRTRKNHHYVPQFYLRNFAPTDNAKEIGLYNYAKGIYVQKAPIKHQACEKFLYGIDDEIEEALSKLEHYTALTLQQIFKSLSPPPENHMLFYVLKEFTLHQLSRTKKAGSNFNEMVSANWKEIFKQSSIYKEEYKDIEFYYQQPTLLSLMYSARAWPLMKYLSCKLIVNKTNLPFITSDAPAVKYNQFLELRKVRQGTTGIATKGLQIFLPIYPALMIIFYDPFVYKLKGRGEMTISTVHQEDIEQLNALQFINCDSQLFFGSGISQSYLKGMTNQFLHVKMKSGHATNSHAPKENSNGESSMLIFHTTNEPQISLNLSFVKLTKEAKHYNLGNSLVHARHPDLVKQSTVDRLNTPIIIEEE